MNIFLKKRKAFSMMEVILYIAITTMILAIISSVIINTINAKKHLKASESIQHNARFIENFMANRIHNVNVIEDVSPQAEQVIFYTSETTRFSFTVENNNLLYREGINSGGGFPPQSTFTPLQVNSGDARISDFVLTPSSDSAGNVNRGVNISFTLTTGDPSDFYGYKQENFQTLIDVR